MDTLENRFWAKVNKTDGCWLWTGAIEPAGYGKITVWKDHLNKWGVARTHRVAWEIANGPVPEGLLILHGCDVCNCVNPAHLFLGTQYANVHDAISKGRRNPPRGANHWSAKKKAK